MWNVRCFLKLFLESKINLNFFHVLNFVKCCISTKAVEIGGRG
jgi:hypothetical protein